MVKYQEYKCQNASYPEGAISVYKGPKRTRKIEIREDEDSEQAFRAMMARESEERDGLRDRQINRQRDN